MSRVRGNADGEAERRRLESPCVAVCEIDESSGLCRGCLRTLDEIALWGSAGPDERRAILVAVDRRRTLDSASRRR